MAFVALTNSQISKIIWQKQAAGNYAIEAQTDIWRINITPNFPHVGTFSEVLNEVEITRANNYLSPLDGKKFIISRGALRHILSNYLQQPPQDIKFNLGTNNKPYVDASIHFNLSDSGDYVLIAVAKSEIGIDIEYIKPGFEYDEILDNYFGKDEGDYIRAENSAKRFFTLWTRKEAILKATGIGLTDDLLVIPSLDEIHKLDADLVGTARDWYLYSFDAAGGYVATIATGNDKQDFSFWEFTLG